MQLGAELRDFTDEVTTWIREHAPRGLSDLVDWSTPWGTMGLYQDVVEARAHELYTQWESEVAAARYICPQWPESVGGRDWDPIRCTIFDIACAEANVPRIERGMGESLVGPSILMQGTEEQQQAFLPRIVSGEDNYCQGFSEPDHGSDLAGVELKGVVEGDEIVMTGQKVWTSGADGANMVFVLCRTDPEAPKHRGISFVLAPFGPENGIEVRTIRMLNGGEEFCEEFFEGARAPLFNVIGGLNNGWAVAMTALTYERGVGATTQYLGYEPEVGALIDQAREVGRLDDPAVRRTLAWAYSHVQMMRYAGLKSMSRLVADKPATALDMINKLHWSEYQLELGKFAIDLDTDYGLLRPDGDDDYRLSRWQDLYLSSRAGTIYAGTSEIQRNIIAERVLGLPKEPRKNA